MSKTQKIIGAGRIIDVNEDGKTCMVRLLDEKGLPQGAIITGIKIASERADVELITSAKQKVKLLPENELDTMARQNIMYNSYMEVEIV